VRLFGWGKPERFVSEEARDRNLARQLAMTPQTLEALRRYGMEAEARLALEYFFYSKDKEHADGLARALEAQGYSAPSVSKRDSTYLITGWTTPSAMDDASVLDWTRRMVGLGYENDCDFDGWGTHPKGGGAA
jgi:hypothetical protein